MTIAQIREKIAYRTSRMEYCRSPGNSRGAEWNAAQVRQLQEMLRVQLADQGADHDNMVTILPRINITPLNVNPNRNRGNAASANNDDNDEYV